VGAVQVKLQITFFFFVAIILVWYDIVFISG